MGIGTVPENYIPILIFIGAAIAVGSITLFLGKFVRPNQPYRAKMAPYESGSPLFQDARVQFPMRYYIIAMLFVIFDVEVIFLYPWAVTFFKIGLVGLIGDDIKKGELVFRRGRRLRSTRASRAPRTSSASPSRCWAR